MTNKIVYYISAINGKNQYIENWQLTSDYNLGHCRLRTILPILRSKVLRREILSWRITAIDFYHHPKFTCQTQNSYVIAQSKDWSSLKEAIDNA